MYKFFVVVVALMILGYMTLAGIEVEARRDAVVRPLPPAPLIGDVVHYKDFRIQELRHGWIIIRRGQMIFVPKPGLPAGRQEESHE
jgi:hypothetical protein